MGIYKQLRKQFDPDLPQVAEIFLKESGGKTSVSVSSNYDDINNCSDMYMVTTYPDGEVKEHNLGVRGRSFKYFASYKDEFTIRGEVISGNKTEVKKILEGKGDFLFYYFRNPAGDKIMAWRIINLHKFRIYLKGYLENMPFESLTKISNGDGSYLLPFNVNDMPSGVVLKSKGF